MFIKKKELLENYQKLERRCDQLEAKIFELKYPNGYTNVDYNMFGHILTIFKYSYDGKIYECKLPNKYFETEAMDYTKTKEGFVFVTQNRNEAFLVKLGSSDYIPIPYPCVC